MRISSAPDSSPVLARKDYQERTRGAEGVVELVVAGRSVLLRERRDVFLLFAPAQASKRALKTRTRAFCCHSRAQRFFLLF